MALALSRGQSAQHGALRPVRQADRGAQEGHAVPDRYERRQAPIKRPPVMIAALYRAAALLALALLPSACANFSAISPGDSAQEVAARVGAPGAVWENADGSEVWEYPQGYFAVQTFMVAVNPDHAVREVRQVLNEAYFSRIQPGMSREDVRHLLGKPREIWYFPARDEETWTWRYYDITYKLFNVLFDRSAGTVRTTLRLDEILFLGGRGKR